MLHQTSNIMGEKGIGTSEIGVSSSFAGLSESTRIRKPPGGDTNDIFGMEDRQRVQAHVQKFRDSYEWNKTQVPKMYSDISVDQEDKCRKDVSDFNDLLKQLNLSKPFKLASYKLDKENLNILSDTDKLDGMLKNKLSEDNLKGVGDDVEVESKNATKKYLRRNPITGEVIEVAVTFRPKLADCSNVAPNQDRVQMRFEAHRPSVRIRHPPGGKSSNIF